MRPYNNRIIGLCGAEGSGKDTTAIHIAECVSGTNAEVVILPFAKHLKAVVAEAFPVPQAILRIDESGSGKDRPYERGELELILQSSKLSKLDSWRSSTSAQAQVLAATYTNRRQWTVPNTPRDLLRESAGLLQSIYGKDYFLKVVQAEIAEKPYRRFVIPDFRYKHEFDWANELNIPLIALQSKIGKSAEMHGRRAVVAVSWCETPEQRATYVRQVATWWKNL